MTGKLSDRGLLIAGLVCVAGLAGFAPALSFPPGEADDLIMLSVAAERESPWGFFVGDWGLDNSAYRPLHSFSVWISYRLVGVAALPSQALNLFLHLVVTLLLFRAVSVATRSPTLAAGSALVFQFSLYTVSPATWISDRPSLFVGLALALLVNHLVACRKREESPSIPIIVGLSVLALLSKETGLVVPGLACLVGLGRRESSRGWAVLCTACVGIVAAYVGFRIAIFGSDAAAYSEAGYLLGTWQFGDWADLSLPMRMAVLAENVLKSFLAPFLPVFGELGALGLGPPESTGKVLAELAVSPVDLLLRGGIVVSSAGLTLLALRRRLTPEQWLGLAIILLNALLHYAVFRYRTLYLSQFGFALFISSLSLVPAWRQRVGAVAAAVLVACSAVWVGRDIAGELVVRNTHVRTYQLEFIPLRGEISEEILEAVIARYQ